MGVGGRWKRRHVAFLVGLLLATVALFVWLPSRIWPAEDAVILYRYSEHLAAGLGVVYNPGGPHAEGATDFGWMVLLCFGRWVGSTYGLALAISTTAAWITVWLLAKIAATRDPQFILPFAALILLSPTLGAAVQGFSVLFFAMVLTTVLWRAVERDSRGLYLASLAACLTRPDAVVLVAPVIVGDLLRCGLPSERLLRLRTCALCLVLPGFVYFCWRFWYFGLPLPLPFYVKVLAAKRLAGLFVPTSAANLMIYSLTVCPLAVAALAAPDRWSWQKLAPAALGAAAFFFYSTSNLEQDLYGRFEYPILIAALVLGAVDFRTFGWTRRLALGWVVSLLLWIPASLGGLLAAYQVADEEPIVNLSKALASLPSGKMATSEAGRLAYYSGWTAIDLWGLNDPLFARRFIQPGDVPGLGADLIVLHANPTLVEHRNSLMPQANRSWDGMVINTLLGMGDDYDLWLVPFEKPPVGAALRASLWVHAHSPLELVQRFAIRSAYRLSGKPGKLRSYDDYLAVQDSHPRRFDLFAIHKTSPMAGPLRRLLETAEGQPVPSTR